jgi:hypothetical protein
VFTLVHNPTNSGAFSSAFIAVYSLDDCRSDWNEMETQCHFDLYVLYG